MQQFRDYRLIVELGMDPDSVDRTAAARLDWLLAIHDAVQQVKAEKRQESSGGGSRPRTL